MSLHISICRNLPCGVPFINPAFNTPSKNPDDDPLYAVSQRFAYSDPNAPKKKSVQVSNFRYFSINHFNRFSSVRYLVNIKIVK